MSVARQKTLRDRAVITGSSVFGLGLVPVAPGTWGTLGAIPIWWALDGQPWWVWLLTVSSVVAISVWIAGMAESLYAEHDVSAIVIDEVAGMLVCVIGVPFQGWTVVLAFLVFRTFDIIKPPPVRWFDENVQGGLGVVIDDVVAGLLGLCVVHGLLTLL